MTRRLLAVLAGVLLVASGVAWADTGRFILRARSAADAETLRERYGLAQVGPVSGQDDDGVFRVSARTGGADEDEALRTLLASDPLTLAVEIDRTISLPEPTSAGLAQSTAAILEGFVGQPPVTYFGNQVPPAYPGQPAALTIRLGGAQARYATGAGIVAVIDTGVDPTHPALAGALLPGYDFVNHVAGIPAESADLTQSTAAILEQSPTSDPNTVAVLNQSTAAILEQSTAAILETTALPAAFGHGTMVAGLIHLVAPTAMIMPLKAFTADGSAQLSDLVSAVYYAVDHGATVVNMSFTVVADSQALLDAIAYGTSKGVLFVAAMGNDGVQATTYPAAWPGVISVASTSPSDVLSTFSNYGSAVDVSAPGEALITTYPGGHYAAAWGTSFSAALVAGGIALFHQLLPAIDEDDAVTLLRQETVPIYLAGARIDLYEALEELIERRWPQ